MKMNNTLQTEMDKTNAYVKSGFVNSNVKANVFETGKRVKIGFLELTCIEQSEGCGHIEAGSWILQSNKGVSYVFLPYHGLRRMEDVMPYVQSVSNMLRQFQKTRYGNAYRNK